MTVSDSSRYWVAKQMIWNVLTDTTNNSAALTLQQWRQQQNPRGNEGTNFTAGNIPEQPKDSDCPALVIRNETGVSVPDELFAKTRQTKIYTVGILGALRVPREKEADGDKMILRFEELVEAAIGNVVRFLPNATNDYLPTGETNPIEDVRPGEPVFPDFGVEGERPRFWLPVHLQLSFADVWIY